VRILFVIPDLPQTPFTGAHTRPLTMLTAAARRHEIFAVGAAPPGSDFGALNDLCSELDWVTLDEARPLTRRVLAGGRRVLTPVPLLSRGRSQAIAGLVARAAARHKPDALFVETMYAIHYRQPGIRTIADLLDVVSGLCESAAAARPLRYAAAGMQAISARRKERELLRDVVPVTINDADRGRLANVGVSAFTVPLAVSLPAEIGRSSGDDREGGSGGEAGAGLEAYAGRVARRRPAGAPVRLLFVGSYLHAPNEEAARYLVRRLAPALRHAGMAFELTLAGRAAPAWLLERASEDIKVLSDVDDLAALYRQADIVLAPLAHGGGTKNKTLEAMAWGLPVLGTPQAFTGLGALDGEAFVCTSLETDDMVADLRRLAADPGLRAHLGAAGRKYVAEAHTEDLAEARAVALFDAVAFGGGVPEAEALWRNRRDSLEPQSAGAADSPPPRHRSAHTGNDAAAS